MNRIAALVNANIVDYAAIKNCNKDSQSQANVVYQPLIEGVDVRSLSQKAVQPAGY